jgi:hypothetical protein
MRIEHSNDMDFLSVRDMDLKYKKPHACRRSAPFLSDLWQGGQRQEFGRSNKDLTATRRST